MIIGLAELLRSRGYEPKPGFKGRVKLIRHKDPNYDIETLYSNGWFETYQSFQSKSIFKDCDQIVVFIGEEWPAARFVGVYDVTPSAKIPAVPTGCPYPEWSADAKYHYTLKKRAGFEDLEDRLVIDWGGSTQGWHQWFTDRDVIQIRAKGRALAPFRDYLRVNLKHSDLKKLVATPEAHKDWVSGLKAVGGVYLIVNGENGQQYVGSATGKDGIWQRWQEYAKTGHGGNKELIKLCKPNGACPAAFTFSILETFSKSLTKAEAIKSENFFKEKLGTRAKALNKYGLNGN
jgi:hypothetical protein